MQFASTVYMYNQCHIALTPLPLSSSYSIIPALPYCVLCSLPTFLTYIPSPMCTHVLYCALQLTLNLMKRRMREVTSTSHLDPVSRPLSPASPGKQAHTHIHVAQAFKRYHLLSIRVIHLIINYAYCMYKGSQILNSTVSQLLD